MVTRATNDIFNLSPSMKMALGVSIVFHVGIVAIGMVGMPFISKPPPLPTQPIAINIVDVSEITTTNKKPSQSRLKPVPDKPKEAPKVEKKVKAPPKVVAKEPPKIKPLDKPVVKKDTVKPKPKTPPPPSEKLEKPKPPEKKKLVEEKKEEATEQEDPLQSLLKNFQESEDVAEGTEEGTANPEFSPDAPLAPTMTANELNSLSNQLAGCWQIPIGAENVHDTVVNIRIWVDADRVVQRAEIADQWRNANDPAFRSLAESAKRATLSPACNPVDIPMDKYDFWKDKYIEIPFDPRSVT